MIPVKKLLLVLCGLVLTAATVRVEGKDLTWNAFLPEGAEKPLPALVEKLKAAGPKDVVYWMTPQGGHAFPGGDGFEKALMDFLQRALAEQQSCLARDV